MQSSALSSFSILGSGLTADQLWMDVIAENLANANTTTTAAGTPYRAQEVVLSQGNGSGGPGVSASSPSFGGSLADAMGVHVSAIVGSPAPFSETYDPGAPGANAAGYVTMPNVNPVTEMSDLVVASQSFDANVSALSVAENTSQAALKIMQGL